ncbi:DUF5723 family protein [Chitinophaga niastensis]|nr:DUF5723 family protein [Chitinophaga niastensis]
MNRGANKRGISALLRETYFSLPTMMVNINRILFSTAVLLLLANIAMAQTFAGYHTSTYAGIYGVFSNPASAAGYRYKWDVNIIGVNINAGNTYVSAPKSTLFHPSDTMKLNRDYFLDEGANRKQNGWEMAEIVLPSVLYAIDDKQSLSFVWRMRTSSNAGNITTPIANFFGVNFPNNSYVGKDLNIPNIRVASHMWHELGLSYARVIKESYSSRWKAGITVKLLSGVAAGYAAVKDVNFHLSTRRDATISSGEMYYAYSKELDNWQTSPTSNLKILNNNGVGADIGVIYEYRPDNGGFGKYDHSDADDYKLRIGVSITDIGKIKYAKGANNTDLSLVKDNINPNDLTYKKKESLKQYAARLNKYFTPLASGPDFSMELPTALNLMGDYNIDSRFFVSANAVIALNAGKRNITKTSAMTQVMVTPRYETTMFGAYLPLVINHNGQADAGVGIRVGPLVLGSYTIFTNLFERRIDHADAFVALRLNSSMFDRTHKQKKLGCPVNNY